MTRSLLVALLLAPCVTFAQTGGGYDLTRSTIDGGGGTFSTSASHRLGATIGQPDAGRLLGGVYVLNGGFWGQVEVAPTPTPTFSPTQTPTRTPTLTQTHTPTRTPSNVPTATPSRTPTRSASPTPTFTGTQPATPTPTATATPSATPSSTPTATPSATPSSTPTTSGTVVASPTPTETTIPTSGPECVGDCNGNGMVSIGELIVGVNIALERAQVQSCPPIDVNDNGLVGINELIIAVANALDGCS